MEDVKLAASKVAPFVRRHPGVTGGFAGGIIAGYRLL